MVWNQTTEEHYNEMFGALPPAAYGNDGAFQVGEPMDHKNGQPTFSSFKIVNGVYFESDEPLTFREFAQAVDGAWYCYEG